MEELRGVVLVKLTQGVYRQAERKFWSLTEVYSSKDSMLVIPGSSGAVVLNLPKGVTLHTALRVVMTSNHKVIIVATSYLHFYH